MQAPRRLADRLNGVLTKGQNRLCKFQYMLVISGGDRWRSLLASWWPTTEQSWGRNTSRTRSISIRQLPGEAAHHWNQGKYLEGATVLENDTCVDDIINSQDAQQDCMVVAEEIIKKIARESMSVKAFTFTGTTSQTRKCPLTGPMSDWPRTCHTHGGRWSSRTHRIPVLCYIVYILLSTCQEFWCLRMCDIGDKTAIFLPESM